MANEIIKKSLILPIDIGDRAVQSTVLRDGVAVKAPVLATTRVVDFIDKLAPISRFSIPRVLEQGIPAGVKVARGTVIDLTLVPASSIKVGLLEVSHAALRDRTVASVANVIDNDLATVLANHDTSTTLTSTERTKVQSALTQLQIQIDDSKPDASFETAFRTLRDVQVFR